MSATSVKESDVGIVYLLTNVPNASFRRFSAVMKHRYSDFRVDEISPDGTVAEWNDAPETFPLPAKDESTNKGTAKPESSDTKDDNTLLPLKDVLDTDDYEKLVSQFEAWKADKTPQVLYLRPRDDKAWRTCVHQAVRHCIGELGGISQSVDAKLWAEANNTEEQLPGSSVMITIGSNKKNKKRGWSTRWPTEKRKLRTIYSPQSQHGHALCDVHARKILWRKR